MNESAILSPKPHKVGFEWRGLEGWGGGKELLDFRGTKGKAEKTRRGRSATASEIFTVFNSLKTINLGKEESPHSAFPVHAAFQGNQTLMGEISFYKKHSRGTWVAVN